MTRLAIALLAMMLAAPAAWAQDTAASNLQDLLRLVNEGKARESAANQQREREFRQARDQQQQLLAQGRAKRASEERRSAELEQTFEDNDLLIADKEQALVERLGALKELFGVLQQVSGDARAVFENSIVSAQYPGRGEFLTELARKMGTSSELASISEMEQLWYELQREMTEYGTIAKFQTEVTLLGGGKETQEVVRIGPFNLVADGKYLQYNPSTGNVAELPRQPQARFTSTASAIYAAGAGQVEGFGVDPTRGQILSLLTEKPNLKERIQQGGLVGYIIIGVGILGLLIALERLVTLGLVSGKVTSQLKNDQINTNNPLGRVLKVGEENKAADTESLELKLGEAILKETPPLTRSLTFLKIISVVAPLMGLLGTVTGMINTFQAITLFGTGDPKLMAGGISQALMTTVLGLCVAIPMVLLHTIVAGRSSRIIHVLQEQAAGIIAERSERSAPSGGQ